MRILSGARFWEIRRQKIDSNRISVWNREVKDNSISSIEGVSVRVLYGNGWGFSSGTDERKAAENAMKIAKVMDSRTKHHVFSGESITDKRRSPRKVHPLNIDFSEKKDFLLSISKDAMKSRLVRGCQVSYGDINIISEYENSEGSSIKQDLMYVNAVCSIIAKGKKIADHSERIGKMSGYEALEGFEDSCNEAKKVAVSLTDAKHASKGNFQIVCDGALTDVFVHEAVGHSCEADIVLQNDSCLKGKIGAKIAGNLNIIDSPEGEDWGSYYYDDEGICANKTYLVKNGVLNSFMHSRQTAALFGCKPTGNSRAEDFSCIPVVRMSNTFMEKGDFEEEELFCGIKEGYFLKGSKGGQVDTKTGSFQFNSTHGYKIKNGKLGHMVGEVSLSGNTLDILKNIDAISKRYEKGQPGMCGKMGQSVRVIGFNPRIRIKKALVGGV